MTRTSFFISLLSVLLLSLAGPAHAETADDVVCDKCVNQKDIAFGAVGTGRIRKDAVTEDRLADSAVSWQKLATELQQKILEMEDRIANLEVEAANTQEYLSENTVLKLDGYLDLDVTDPTKPTALFTGVNVQLINGTGKTKWINGLGNLVIGYNLPKNDGIYMCSDGSFSERDQCLYQGGVWAVSHKSGSHNLVIGDRNNYSRTSGLVSGRYNSVTGFDAAVLGGYGHLASGGGATVVGGNSNTASGNYSSVTGGLSNIASGNDSSVSGGRLNTAWGDYSFVGGGELNYASGIISSVSGGSNNVAQAHSSSISGGRYNETWGRYGSIQGGYSNYTGPFGSYSSISGGSNRETEDQYNWAAGGLWQQD